MFVLPFIVWGRGQVFITPTYSNKAKFSCSDMNFDRHRLQKVILSVGRIGCVVCIRFTGIRFLSSTIFYDFDFKHCVEGMYRNLMLYLTLLLLQSTEKKRNIFEHIKRRTFSRRIMRFSHQ